MEFEIYFFNGFQMQPQLHNSCGDLELIVPAQVLQQIHRHHRDKVQSEMCWQPEQKGDGLNGVESWITINYLMKY